MPLRRIGASRSIRCPSSTARSTTCDRTCFFQGANIALISCSELRHHDHGSVRTDAELLALAHRIALQVSFERCAFYAVVGGVGELGHIRRIANLEPVDRADVGLSSAVPGSAQGFRESWFRKVSGASTAPKAMPPPRTGGGPGSIPSNQVQVIVAVTGTSQFPVDPLPPAGIGKLPCRLAHHRHALPRDRLSARQGTSSAAGASNGALAAAKVPGRGPSGVGSSQGWRGWAARLSPGLPCLKPAGGGMQERRRHAGEVGSPSGLPPQNSGKLCR